MVILIMIIDKNFNKSGVKITPLFSKFYNKKMSLGEQNGYQGFSLNSEKGVLTPSWRILGTKKCHQYSEQINLFCCIKFRYANFNTFIQVIDVSANNLDDVFLSYKKILRRLKLLKIKTRNGKEITHKDLRKAIEIMEKKHISCRWKSEKVKSKKYYILIEGFYWLIYVYFQNEKSLIDADIEFFLLRIKQYQEELKVQDKNLFTKDMSMDELVIFFQRKYRTIEKAVIKMLKETSGNYRYKTNGKFIISKDGIEWLCKNCFKQKYLEILEQYKMELTEQYIAKGYIYDNFFGKN